ncbi:McrC family protein [Chloroflexota bacterium]
MRELSVTEYSHITLPSSDLVEADLEYLSRLRYAGRIGLTVSPDGDARIQLSSCVGVIQLSKVRLEIVPKIEGPLWPLVLIHMLSRVYGVKDLERLSATPFSTQSELIEGFTEYFLGVIDKLISEGLCLGYIRIRAHANALRGRVLLRELYRPQFVFGGGIPCEYELLSEERLENRIIKASLDRVSRLPLDRHLQTPLRYIMGLFNQVPTDGNITGDSVDDVVFTRLNDHYRHSLALCKLILDHLFIAFSSGGVPFHSFLVDMNELFEKYVVMVLSDNLDVQYRLRSHPHFRIEGNPNNTVRSVTLEPDFIIDKWGTSVLVGDVKYKGALIQSPFSTEGFRNPDFYQALAYAVVADVPALLVYPAHAVGSRIADTFRLTRNTVGIVTVDLSLPLGEIGKEVIEFAEVLFSSATTANSQL